MTLHWAIWPMNLYSSIGKTVHRRPETTYQLKVKSYVETAALNN
jgi:hypothetical protein